MPPGSGQQTFLRLLGLVVLKSVHDDGWQGDRPAALACFGLHKPQLAGDALQAAT